MRRLLERRERLGLTYRELEAETGVPAHTLSWWAWKLRKEETEHPRFVELVADAENGDAALDVVLRCGRVIRVPAGFEDDHLRRLVSALESC
ncbi:MAG TPA: hypothetical protein ENJ16_05900 [Planctomycetaceae bacterium]|nr:hypothetical protein [Planctomycetaceae bacterium]